MPTPLFCCGAECGIAAAGATGGAGVVPHWNSVVGPVSVDTGTVRSGSRSYKFAAAGALTHLQKTISGAPAVGVTRFAIYFESLPSTNTLIMAFSTAGSWAFLGFVQSTSKLCVTIVTSMSPLVESTTTIQAGQWYVIDYRVVMNGNPWVISWKIDGVAQPAHRASASAQTILAYRLGAILDTTPGTPTYNLFADDIIYSITNEDYPFGNGKVAGLYPNADGTHNFDTAGDFMYNNTVNIPTNATDVFSYIDDVLDNITDFIAVPAASNTEYVEVAFADLGNDVVSINGLEVAMAAHAAATQANLETLRINDGGTLSDVATDLDFSNTTITYHSKHYATAPSTSAAWTKSKVDALLARWNSSYGTVDESPVPFLDGLVLEVDYVPTITTLPPLFRGS